MTIKFSFNDMDSITENIKHLIIARRDADNRQQQIINGLLAMLYNAKYNLLRKLYN